MPDQTKHTSTTQSAAMLKSVVGPKVARPALVGAGLRATAPEVGVVPDAVFRQLSSEILTQASSEKAPVVADFLRYVDLWSKVLPELLVATLVQPEVTATIPAQIRTVHSAILDIIPNTRRFLRATTENPLPTPEQFSALLVARSPEAASDRGKLQITVARWESVLALIHGGSDALVSPRQVTSLVVSFKTLAALLKPSNSVVSRLLLGSLVDRGLHEAGMIVPSPQDVAYATTHSNVPPDLYGFDSLLHSSTEGVVRARESIERVAALLSRGCSGTIPHLLTAASAGGNLTENVDRVLDLAQTLNHRGLRAEALERIFEGNSSTLGLQFLMLVDSEPDLRRVVKNFLSYRIGAVVPQLIAVNDGAFPEIDLDRIGEQINSHSKRSGAFLLLHNLEELKGLGLLSDAVRVLESEPLSDEILHVAVRELNRNDPEATRRALVDFHGTTMKREVASVPATHIPLPVSNTPQVVKESYLSKLKSRLGNSDDKVDHLIKSGSAGVREAVRELSWRVDLDDQITRGLFDCLARCAGSTKHSSALNDKVIVAKLFEAWESKKTSRQLAILDAIATDKSLQSLLLPPVEKAPVAPKQSDRWAILLSLPAIIHVEKRAYERILVVGGDFSLNDKLEMSKLAALPLVFPEIHQNRMHMQVRRSDLCLILTNMSLPHAVSVGARLTCEQAEAIPLTFVYPNSDRILEFIKALETLTSKLIT